MTGDSHMLSGAQEGERRSAEDDYDALAELFLGDPASDDGPTGSIPPAAEPARATEADASEPDPSESDPIEPDSMKSDEIAGRIGAPGTASGTARRVEIEALALGHLPVMSAPWAAQHAARTAERWGESVGLLRLMGGQAAVEVFGATAALRPASTLREAIEEGGRGAARWIVCVDAIDEPELVARGVDGVTLLCAADQAAVVGGYRTLKGLVERAESADGGGPWWRAAVVGASGEEAERAFSRLERAAEAFLGGRLERGGDLPKMGPMRTQRLYRGRLEDVESAVSEALEAIRGLKVPEREHDLQKMQTPQGKTLDPFDPGGVSKAWRSPVDSPRPSGSSDPGRVEPRASDVLLHAASDLRPGAGAAFTEHLAGLSALAARCPWAPKVELAVDGDGGLHLVTEAGGSAIEALTIVEGWLRDHGALVAMASGGRRVDPSRGISWHVVTEEPAAVRRLLDSRAQAHLVAPVEIDGKRGWISKRLN